MVLLGIDFRVNSFLFPHFKDIVSLSSVLHLVDEKFPIWASLITWLVKDPPAMQETQVQFLGQEDPLEKGETTHCRILGLTLCLRW